MAKARRASDEDAPEFEVGEYYQYAAPGGFLFFGQYVKPLSYGKHRFANVRHLRNAGNVELPQMCKSGLGANTQVTKHKWRYHDCTPIWSAPWDAEAAPGGE
jgi:hypothetical protein